jgi:NAD(P)H-dependent flavin oxidoreductase YrpB (nitropropane dioxygenase family)
MTAPRSFAATLGNAARLAAGRPVAANLLVPFIKPAHIHACVERNAALVVLHGGLSPRWVARLRQRGLEVFVTVGTPAQAVRALAAHASGLVVQGFEAGGHLLGVEPIERALPAVLEVAGSAPVLAAGGIVDARDARRLLDMGAVAAVAGTRFLLTAESGAHPEYKRRVVDAGRTLATFLFGLGWPLRHRVIPNAATARWCTESERDRPLVRAIARLSEPLGRVSPLDATARLAALQRLGLPFFTPTPPVSGMPAGASDCCALYAGETALRLHDILPAAQAVELLAPA